MKKKLTFNSPFRNQRITLLFVATIFALLGVATLVLTRASNSSVTINDNVIGTGVNQWQYTGADWVYYTDGPNNKYQGDDHSSGVAGDYATLKFSGVQAAYFGPKDVHAGIVAISVNGGAETMVDLYSATRIENTALFTTPLLSNGTHTMKIRLTGSKNPASVGIAAAVDRAVVTSDIGDGKALSFEAEDGTRSGSVNVVADTTASGGQAVKFGRVVPPATLTKLPPQPAVLIYGGSTALSAYAKPGAMVAAGRDNYQDQGFKDVSAAGGTVLIYLDVMIDNPYGRYHSMLLESSECGPATALWPGSPTANEWGKLTDFRVGSTLQNKLECVLEKMVAENPHMAGWFVDDVGSRSWFPNINWSTFGASNQQAYRDGAIAVTQTFRKVADRYGLIFIVNGTWGAGSLAGNGGGYPDMDKPGNALADGGFVENHTASELPYWTAYSCSTQWAAQSPVTRGTAFMWAVFKSTADRDAYASTNCFAFLAVQDTYSYVAPWTSFHPTGLPSRVTQ